MRGPCNPFTLTMTAAVLTLGLGALTVHLKSAPSKGVALRRIIQAERTPTANSSEGLREPLLSQSGRDKDSRTPPRHQQNQSLLSPETRAASSTQSTRQHLETAEAFENGAQPPSGDPVASKESLIASTESFGPENNSKVYSSDSTGHQTSPASLQSPEKPGSMEPSQRRPPRGITPPWREHAIPELRNRPDRKPKRITA